MRELMADGADAINLPTALVAASELRGAGITAELHTILVDIGIGAGIVDTAGMRPQQAAIIATDIGTVSGKNEIDHIDHSIAIGVIVFEIHIRINGIDNIEH